MQQTQHDATTNPNLDFIRAIAVVLVIIDHTLLAFDIFDFHGLKSEWLGLTGVWIFFVHTALVLMWSLERRPFTLDFYIRRAFRIYPLALCAIFTVVITHASVTGFGKGLFDFTPFTTGNIVATSLLLYNLVPNANYMPIEYVIWSLPLEVEMYILLPVIFAFSRRDRTLLPLFLGWLLAAAIAFPSLDRGMHFLTAIPDFLPGIMAFVIFKWARPSLPFSTLPVLLLASITGIMFFPAVSTGWVFCLILGLSLPFYKSLRNNALKRISHTMAKYSYGAYIAHPFALLLGIHLLHAHSLAVQLSVELAAIIAISVPAYHLVEKPMIDVGSRVAARIGDRHAI